MPRRRRLPKLAVRDRPQRGQRRLPLAAAGGAAGDGGRPDRCRAVAGQPRWTFAGAAAFTSAPAIVDGVVSAASEDGIVVALDAATGTEQWRIALDGPVSFGPVVVGGLLYVSTGAGTLDAIAGSEDAATAGARSPTEAATPDGAATPPSTGANGGPR